ncbi:MAG: AAA family ATPase [Desulfobacterales bacterium]|nr:MAG: AAA family ATPase [Desulfobacterales bacterium]
MPLVVFDEIHKYKDWKNYLKGVYDRFKEEFLFLVSGSGRLDIYQKGGGFPWRALLSISSVAVYGCRIGWSRSNHRRL